jgi:hypothetical protein
MHINPWLIPTLLLAFLLFSLGFRIWGGCVTKSQKLFVMVCAIIAAIPALLFCAYYLHILDRAVWFYQFRSLPGIEIAAAGAGFSAGVISRLHEKSRFGSRLFLLAILFLVILTPHLKPLVGALPEQAFSDRWQDGVCLQSTEASCGPASAATILKSFGIEATEQELVRECFTYRGGTENWYLARALRRRGVAVNYRIMEPEAGSLPVPSIAGVKVSRFGHFIPIIAETADSYITGDPMIGKRVFRKSVITKHYNFTGFFMELKR